ncbi:hypothetical protein [Acetilactobacillus jinshanensis]|uniref:hypothetical protein n=1 Tax=Acetilactobacillus jinshanensis TaxID=1720083 RepID=UPI0013A654A1|nr:hypothetical protein [Acetilactobacillus jinshanensis]URL60613.1 hypothetical protein HGK75_00880 [uncultured bacterium]
MDTQQWLVHQLTNEIKHEPKFKPRALLERTRDLVKEQSKRLKQAQMELDGRTWNHAKW